jgi:glycerol-3-phosphate dehydrogenase (NAD(P)+)
MIAVCGAGSWGTALAAALARNTTAEIKIWGREREVLQEITTAHTNTKYLPGIKLPKNIRGCSELSDLLRDAQDILIVVPSKAFLEVLRLLKPYLSAKHRIIWATKGLEPKQGRLLHEVVAAELGSGQVYAVLGGPSFAKEVARQLPTAVTIAAANIAFGNDLLKYFHNENFRVYLNTDVIGVQIGGVLKNIFAVATGLSDGLGYGANARAALITRSLAEMQRLGVALGAKMETLQGLAGMGDLVLTCTDDQSRNRRFGLALAQGKSVTQAQTEIGQIVEAVHNVTEVTRIARAHNVEMPIAEQVYKIVTGNISPQDAVRNLITRKPVHESGKSAV